MTRFLDWPARLEKFLAHAASQRFQYGSIDCCLFACSAIESMTGVDPAEPFRGRYRTRAEAIQAIREYTGSPSVRAVAEKVTAEHGMPSCQILQARRGDLALIRRPRDYSLGIVALNGQDIIVATKQGVERIPISSAAKAWHV